MATVTISARENLLALARDLRGTFPHLLAADIAGFVNARCSESLRAGIPGWDGTCIDAFRDARRVVPKVFEAAGWCGRDAERKVEVWTCEVWSPVAESQRKAPPRRRDPTKRGGRRPPPLPLPAPGTRERDLVAAFAFELQTRPWTDLILRRDYQRAARMAIGRRRWYALTPKERESLALEAEAVFKLKNELPPAKAKPGANWRSLLQTDDAGQLRVDAMTLAKFIRGSREKCASLDATTRDGLPVVPAPAALEEYEDDEDAEKIARDRRVRLLGSLEQLDDLGPLARRVVEATLELDESPDRYGGREHHRLLTEAGVEISHEWLRRLWPHVMGRLKGESGAA